MIVPLFDLASLLGLPPATGEGDPGKSWCSGAGMRWRQLSSTNSASRLNLLLQPMTGLLSGMRGIAGTGLLGDGR